MPRDAPAFPAPGDVGDADLPGVLRAVLCAPERPWSTVVLRGRWAGGTPLGDLWRVAAVHAEGDGVVVVLEGGERALTVVSPRGARVVHRRDTVSVTIASAARAVLTDGDGVRQPSFEVRGRRARDVTSGRVVPWPSGRQPWRRRATGSEPLPAVELVALL